MRDPTGALLRREAAGGRPVTSLAAYFDLSQKPLQILLFLFPLILLYELGTWRYATHSALSGGGGGIVHIDTVSAYKMLIDFFQVFGLTGLYLPGVVLVTVLLIWHILSRDRWELHPGVPMVMIIESLILSLPLLVLYQLIWRFLAPSSGTAGLISPASFHHLAAACSPVGSAGGGEGGGTAAALASLPWQMKLTLSVGAGLYEELLFRWVLIAFIHFLFADIMGVKNSTALLIALVISALAFMLYHDLRSPVDGSISIQRIAFFFMAGLFFASVYIVRGFGVAVGTHAMYDALVLVILPLALGH